MAAYLQAVARQDAHLGLGSRVAGEGASLGLSSAVGGLVGVPALTDRVVPLGLEDLPVEPLRDQIFQAGFLSPISETASPFDPSNF